jgi:membrane-associated HD superfamily phosphohydrolase
MMNRADIEKILTLNGVPPTAPDEEIKSVLIQARWNEEDIDTAIVILRENKETHEKHIDKLHKVFYSDDRLDPKAISELLGLHNVSLSSDALTHKAERRNYRKRGSAGQLVSIVLLALLISLTLIVFMMWYYSSGLFYPV